MDLMPPALKFKGTDAEIIQFVKETDVGGGY